MKRRSTRPASARARQNWRKPGVLSPAKGIVRNSCGSNQFVASYNKTNVEISANLVTPTTNAEEQPRL